MKLLLIIPYIVSMISGSQMLNPAYNNQTTKNTITDFAKLKQCYQCNLAVDNPIDANTLFNEQCANQTISCDNLFCSTLLSKNLNNEEYRLQLGCISENYCNTIMKYHDAINDNQINCCYSDLCNDGTILPFSLEINNVHFIDDSAPANQTINHEAVIPNLAHDFSFADSYLDNSCINELFFTNQDNLIITLKNNDCYYKRFNSMPKDSLPAFPSQPIVKIIFLDKNNKTITDLISSNTAITNINYIKNKNLLFFIADNNVFVYKLDDNKQLKKISQLNIDNNPIDIAINYNAKIIAVTNKDTVYFYNIDNIEQTHEFIEIVQQLQGANIYKLKYAPNRDILLVKRYDSNYVYTDIYNVENFSKIIYINKSVKQKRNRFDWWPVENIKYNPYKLDFYHGKSIISPVDNLIVNLKVHSGFSSNSDSRIDFLSGIAWYYKNDTNSYYTLYNDYIYAPWYLIPDESIKNGLDYFFATKNKPVMGFIMYLWYSDKALFLKEIRDKYFDRTLDKSDGHVISYFENQPKMITSIKIFHNARSGLFNNDNSKIAVFGHKRIQIYNVNLDNYARSKTTKTPKTKNTATEIKNTKLPEIKSTAAERKTTGFELLFPSSKKNINATNVNNTKKQTF